MLQRLTLLGFILSIGMHVTAQRAVCSQDTVMFVKAKTTGYDTLVIDPTFTQSLYQYYDAPQDVIVEGVRFYAFKIDTAGGNTMDVTIEVRTLNEDSVPTNNILASATATLTIPDSLNQARDLFANVVTWTPVTLDEPYAVIITTPSTSPNYGIFHNFLNDNNGTGDGNEEWLSGAFQGTGWIRSYVYNPTGVPFNSDFFLEPIVRYSINPSFINDPECLFDELGDTVDFFNDGAPIVDNRFYNRYAFFGLPDGQVWNFGDGSPILSFVNPSHFYPTNGPYAATMTTKILSWTQQTCTDQVTQIIKEKPEQDFSYITNNLEVSFTNETSGLFSDISYTFGDKDSSYSFNENPVHKYSKPGTYWVCQTMMTSCGEIQHCENVAVATNTALNCGKDSVRYTAARGTNVQTVTLRAPYSSGSRYLGLGQRFNTPQSLIVHGFTFYANHDGLFRDSYEVTGRIWLRNSGNLPDYDKGPLAKSTVRINKVTVDSMYSDTVRYTAIFNKAVNLKKGEDYILTLEYEGSTNVMIGTTDWLENDGDGDILAIAKIADSTWVTAASVGSFNISGQPFDADVILEPLVEYNLDANWSWSYVADDGSVQDECLTFGPNGQRLVNFEDLSSRIIRDEIYNTIPFYSSSLDAFNWDFGDGVDSSNQVDALHIFTNPGPFDVTLTVSVDGWQVECRNSQTLNIPVAPTAGWGYEQITSQVNFIDSAQNVDEYWWTFDDSTYSSLSDPIHFFTRVGTFEVCQYVSNVCGSDTLCDSIVINVVGIPEDVMENLSIFPNPAQDFINVNVYEGYSGSMELKLRDLSGRIVKHINITDANTSFRMYVGDLARGPYMLEISTGEYTGTKKFILSD